MIDSNIILDVITNDSQWFNWSSGALKACAQDDVLIINSVIYAEVSVGFSRIEEVELLFTPPYFQSEQIPREACFLAGKCFVEYRRKGGAKRSPLPDFFIGSHALVRGHRLLTRDQGRYRTYFPKLKLITPP
jgi:predicted nucleic acid-binding protein